MIDNIGLLLGVNYEVYTPTQKEIDYVLDRFPNKPETYKDEEALRWW